LNSEERRNAYQHSGEVTSKVKIKLEKNTVATANAVPLSENISSCMVAMLPEGSDPAAKESTFLPAPVEAPEQSPKVIPDPSLTPFLTNLHDQMRIKSRA
jgi:hypothetical protein